MDMMALKLWRVMLLNGPHVPVAVTTDGTAIGGTFQRVCVKVLEGGDGLDVARVGSVLQPGGIQCAVDAVEQRIFRRRLHVAARV